MFPVCINHLSIHQLNHIRTDPTVYTLELLLSLKDTPFCRDKPVNLPEFIDRDKVSSESSLGRGARKARRQGSADGDTLEVPSSRIDAEGSGEFIHKNRMGHPGGRRDNVGWQPSNHQEHADQFINRYPVSKFAQQRSGEVQGRIIPGKGVPRRGVDSTGTNGPRPLEHQPALANVVTRQTQGFANFNTQSQTQGGLDAFSMGDIRQAERFLESGRMGLDEYARKVQRGEISREAPMKPTGHSDSFFADDDGAANTRPWLQSTVASTSTAPVTQGRLVPGYASQRSAAPPPPPPPQVQAPRVSPTAPAKTPPTAVTGADSNAQGLALLQMLIDKKATGSPAPSKASMPTAAPRQLTQQQINELISMSKRAAPKAQSHVPTSKGMQAPQPLVRPNVQQIPKQPSVGAPMAGALPTQTPPHVAALLEQLHKQQIAQQQQSQTGATQPPECQQQ